MNFQARALVFQARFQASATRRPAPGHGMDHDTDPVRGRAMGPGR
jgi:hypothetical protein